jgi:hypothetical protein
MDRIFWELYRRRAAKINDRAAREWYLPKARRPRTRRPFPKRDSD